MQNSEITVTSYQTTTYQLTQNYFFKWYLGEVNLINVFHNKVVNGPICLDPNLSPKTDFNLFTGPKSPKVEFDTNHAFIFDFISSIID